MSSAPISRIRSGLAILAVRASREPGWKAEVAVWIALIAVTIGIRACLVSLVPFAVWTDDAGSYAAAASRWLTTGVWVSDGRRGPVYSLLIAGCMKVFGTIDSLMIVQHVMGAVAVLLTMVVLRLLHGRAALWPLAACSYAYAVYALPISLEHLVRNETVLVFCSTVALVAWFCAIHSGAAWWYVLAGFAGSITALTKSIFAPFPLLVVGAILFAGWRTPGPAFFRVVLFAVGLALPHLGVRALNATSPWLEPREPQSGILLFGRTAQFTHLEGGIEPEMKAIIRPDIESYRQLPKLDNNVIVNRTAVPRLRDTLTKRGKTPADLDRLCRSLAVEAIMHHKLAYLRQILSDCHQLHFTTAKNYKIPKSDAIESLESLLQKSGSAPSVVDIPATLAKARAIKDRQHFAGYYRWTSTSWLFRIAPVLLTSLLLPWLIWQARGEMRLWWMGCAGLWYFTVVLLCTVGRPMDRYVLPMAPVMFWALGSGVVLGWQALTRRALSTEMSPRESRNPNTAPDEYLRT